MSKKKAYSKNKKEKGLSKNNLLIIGVIIAAVILVGVAYYYLTTHPTVIPGDVTNAQWALDASGHLTFPEARGSIQANSTPSDLSNDNYTVETVVYKSFGDDVYASLMIPKNVTRPPVVIVLPALTITKELDLPMAQYLAGMGYASLTLDERGFGQTGGVLESNYTDGFYSYVNDGIPIQYKQIYDALKGLDYVKSRNDLNGSDTAILGESIGGMWSIIAAGTEPQFKGVICVSSSDFSFTMYDNNSAGNITANSYLNSIQPSNYLSLLPPRKLVMIHFTDDPIIPIADGKALYEKASQPKVWYQYNGNTHGLPNATYMPDLQRELRGMLGK